MYANNLGFEIINSDGSRAVLASSHHEDIAADRLDDTLIDAGSVNETLGEI